MTTPTTDSSRIDHRRMREALGAWVLGALDGPGRREVEAHLAGCMACAAEVADLSPLPGLLNRVSDDEATDGRLLPDRAFTSRLGVELAREQATVHQRLARWRAGAFAALAVAAVVAGVGLVDQPTTPTPGTGMAADRMVVPVRPVAAEAGSTRGEAAALSWDWGTTVELDLTALPDRDAYTLWVVAGDGRREQAGTWGETDDRSATLRGASSIARGDIDHLEVTDAAGEVLLTFAFPGT